MNIAIRLFEDPRLFSFVILVLYVLNCGRWAIHGNWGQTVYWAAAFLITFSVTFMMGAK